MSDPERRGRWVNRYDFAGVLERCERALEHFAGEDVSRVLLLGDLAHDGDLPCLRRVLRIAASDVPLLAVGGNHDGPRPTGQIARAGGDAVRLPGWRAVGGPVRLAGLRVVRRGPHRWAATRPPALRTWGDATVLLASHFPVLSQVRAITGQGLPHAGDLVGRAAVARALGERKAPTVVASGHLHVRYSAAEGPVLQLGLGAVVEPPFDATVIELQRDGGTLEVTRRALELDEVHERRDPRLAPDHESWRFEPRRGWRRT